jgi:hypothetical protein
MQKQISILNAVSGAADCVTTSGTTAITGLTPFQNTNLQSLQVFKNLVATPMRWTYSIPLVNNGVVSFRMVQTVNELIRDAVFTYTFGATASQSELKTAIDDWYSAQGFSGSNTVTAASPTTGVLVGSDSNVNIQMFAITGLTVTYAMATFTGDGTGTANVVGTPVKVVFSASHGLSTGDTLVFGSTWATTNGLLIANVQSRITYVSATTISVDSVLATATSAITTAGTATKVAQEGFGSVAFVNDYAATNGSSQTATLTTNQYNCAVIRGTYPVSTNGSLQIADVFEATLWYPANLVASPYTAFTNTSALESALTALVV